jgi:hypothetical protein
MAGFALGRASVNQSMETLIGQTLVPAILDSGYTFDFTDDGAIAEFGLTHRVLIVPNVDRIPLATLQKIDAWAAKGGKVIFTKRMPAKAPGLKEERRCEDSQALAGQLPSIDEAALPAAIAQRCRLMPPCLAGSRLRASLAAFAEIYFWPTPRTTVKGTVAFRVRGHVLWNRPSGTRSPASSAQPTSTPALAPYEIARYRLLQRGKAPPSPHPQGTRRRRSERRLDRYIPRLAARHLRLSALMDRRSRAQILIRHREPTNASSTASHARPLTQSILVRARRLIRTQEDAPQTACGPWLESPIRDARRFTSRDIGRSLCESSVFKVDISSHRGSPGENTIRCCRPTRR